MARPEVVVGQVWQDTDKRRCERFVRVLEVIVPDESPIPLDARVRSCNDKGEQQIDCPRTFLSIYRLRTRFRLIRQPDGTPTLTLGMGRPPKHEAANRQ